MLRKTFGVPFWVWYFLIICPFLAGGFYTYMSMLSVVVLVLALIKQCRIKKKLKIVLNLNFVTVLSIVISYCVTPLWAADKGMAIFGILRFCPLFLMALLLMQYENSQKDDWYILLPLSGAVLTLVSCMAWIIPAAQNFVLVNGRLSGFLQYPNTFAAFLLTGLSVLGTKRPRSIADIFLVGLLIAGVFFSGSRISVLLLLFLPLIVAIFCKKKIPGVLLLLIASLCFFVFALLYNGSQITFLGRDIGSLFVRFLYYKDAIPVIFKHPFGLGYMGYRALETTFQTSRYTVSFVHSGLLQMFLDIGWIPSILFVSAVIKTLSSPNVSPTSKSVLSIMSAHALFDFDLQFFLFWAICLICLDFENGTVYQIELSRPVAIVFTSVVLAISIWLGCADWLYQIGSYHAALKLTPFHTDALVSAMKTTNDPLYLDFLADKILSMNPTHALAYSAKANAAYARGQVAEMIRYKEKAIQLTPYTTEEYCDYIEKLYSILELYVRNGDDKSAGYCLEKILSVPSIMREVAARTDPLAYKTGNNSELILPDEYQLLISALEKANSK